MLELPLFPLNTVLFPGMPLELHIFEERYKLMIGMCIEKRLPFGVLLLQSGTAEYNPHAPSIPYMIGCTAQITQVKPLTEGRMNITIVGKERFKIHSIQHDKPYLVGMVEMIPMDVGDVRNLMRDSRRLRNWIIRYLTVLQTAGQLHFESKHLPNDPIALAYLGAVLLQGVAMSKKQQLLASEQMADLVNDLCTIYRSEVALLRAFLNPPTDEDGIFSLN
jgi:uncharacterized protein